MDVYLKVMTQREFPGRMFPLSVGQTLRVGRSSSNDVHLEHPAVSRAHCEVGRDGCGVWARDVGTTNGTRFRDRWRIRDEMWRLRPGDRVELPVTMMRVGYTPADRAVLAWNDGLVPRLAADLGEDPAADRFAVLADALEEAGCVDAELLAHCRRGPHVPGCWAAAWAAGVDCLPPRVSWEEDPREEPPVFYETSGFERLA